MLYTWLPWALAGLAGYFVPRWFHVREDWQRAIIAALAGIAVWWLQRVL
ncbi:MAG: hypothetical protein K0R39_1994 [Symbiobacteriaceae bacterium]|nr:hypothetical protein [Symbiobacteriaceae bacterium]